MTRTEKIDYIKEVFPGLYKDLSKSVKHLLESPDEASREEISMYNEKVSSYLTHRAISSVIVWSLEF